MVPKAQSLGGKLRFDVYEVDSHSGELRKLGVRIPLEDRPFRALVILTRQANEVVTREELQKELWPPDVFIDFEHGLNTVIRKIRLALNDRADKPRFIETVGRRGYRFLARVEQETRVAPETAIVEDRGTGLAMGSDGVQNAALIASAALDKASPRDREIHVGRRGRVLAVAAGVVLVLILAYLFRPATPLLRVTRIVQLTKSGGATSREPLLTDGPRVYYRSLDEKEGWSIRQVLLNGNEDTTVGIPGGRFVIRGLSRDDTEFLAIAQNEEQSTVWTVPVAGGSPHRVGNLFAGDIAWSHDGNRFAYALGNQLFLANADGTSSRALATVATGSAVISHVRWSPDDRQLRFTLSSAARGGR